MAYLIKHMKFFISQTFMFIYIHFNNFKITITFFTTPTRLRMSHFLSVQLFLNTHQIFFKKKLLFFLSLISFGFIKFYIFFLFYIFLIFKRSDIIFFTWLSKNVPYFKFSHMSLQIIGPALHASKCIIKNYT